MRRATTRLVLARESIRVLSRHDLQPINGAGVSIVVQDCPKWPDPPMMAPTDVTRCYDCPPAVTPPQRSPV